MSIDDLQILKSKSHEGLHKNSDIPLNSNQTSNNSKRQAAVLIPLVKSAGQWHILYIRRAANNLDKHSGQVAFPGGSQEADDNNATATALRETHEEIGLESSRIKVIGQIDQYVTVSHFEVTPVIGIIQWPSNLKLQPTEVARAFLIPLNWLRDPNNFTLRARSELDPQSAKRHPIIVYNEFDGETLWGATARMTINFIKAVDEGNILLPS